jgi:hypothetical protein
MRIAILALLSLTACGADVETACQNYLDAYQGCAKEAYGDAYDSATYDLPASTCDVYQGTHDQASADLLNCYADAYSNGDCSTSDGLAAIGTDITTSCAQ